MTRQLIALALASLFLLPDPSLASEGEEAARPARENFIGSPILWGAFSLLNSALLTSSIIDLKFYNDRASALEDEGGDATPYWDASSREKVIIGLSSISLIFSLAALRKSFQKPEIDSFTLPALAKREPNRVEETPEKGLEIISHQGRVRYDTLYTGREVGDGTAESESGAALLSFDAQTRVDTVAIDPAFTGDGEIVQLMESDEQEGAESVVAQAQIDDPISGIIESLPWVEGAGPPAADGDAPPEVTEEETILAAVEEVETIPEGSFPLPHGDTGFTQATFTLLPFAVHVSSFKNFKKAEEVERLWGRRAEPFTIEERDLGGEKGIWYRVLIRNYATWEEASAGAAELKELYSIDYVQAVRRTGY